MSSTNNDYSNRSARSHTSSENPGMSAPIEKKDSTEKLSSTGKETSNKTSLVQKLKSPFSSYKEYKAEKMAAKNFSTTLSSDTAKTSSQGSSLLRKDSDRSGESSRHELLPGHSAAMAAARERPAANFESLSKMSFQTTINLNGADMVRGADRIVMRPHADALPTVTTATQEFTALGDVLGYGNGAVEQNAGLSKKLNDVITRSFDEAGRFQLTAFREVLQEKLGVSKSAALMISDDTVETLQTNAALVQTASKEKGTLTLSQFADKVVARQLALLLRTDTSGDPISHTRGNGNTKMSAVTNLNAQIKTIVSTDQSKKELAELPKNTQKALEILRKEMKNNKGELTGNHISAALKKAKVDHSEFIEDLITSGKVKVNGEFKPSDKLSGGGCGAVMRSAPVGEFFARQVNSGALSVADGLQATLEVGMRTGASTHASPLAFVPAAYHAALVFLASTDAAASMTPREMHEVVVQQLDQEGLVNSLASTIKGADHEAFKGVWNESVTQLKDGVNLHNAMKKAAAGTPLANLGLNTPQAIYNTGLQFSHLKGETSRIDVANFTERTAEAGPTNSSGGGYWPGRSGDDATIMSYEVVWRAMDYSADLKLPEGREAMDCSKTEIREAFAKLDLAQKETFISDVWKMGGFHDGDSDSTNAVACSFLVPLLGAENMKGVFAEMRDMLHNDTIK